MDDVKAIREENAKIITSLLLFAMQERLTIKDISAINHNIKELKRRGIIPIDDTSIKETVLL